MTGQEKIELYKDTISSLQARIRQIQLEGIKEPEPDGMDIEIIYRYQLESIEDTLRKTNNLHNCSTKKTCFDRDVCEARQYTNNALNREIKKRVNRL